MSYSGFDYVGYGLIILGSILTLAAQFFVNSKYNKYKRISNDRKITGVEVARQILDENGLTDIHVTETSGMLSDHYDPNRKVIRLSKEIFHGDTIAAASVAAHECGHAIQHKEGYFFIKLRGLMVPFVNFASKFGYIAIFIGILFSWMDLAWAGIGLLLLILLFQLVTLPTELDASKRALMILEKDGLLTSHEITGGREMLRAAAFTYVASLATTLLEIFRLILIVSNRDDRN